MDEKINSNLQEITYVQQNKNDGELKPENYTKKGDTLFLYIVVLTSQLLILVAGTSAVWTSPALIKLNSNDTAINPLGRPITTTEISMLAGIPNLTGLFGTLFLPKLSDVLGRKKYLLLMGFFILLSGISLAFSRSIIYLTGSRCLYGIFLQGSFSVVGIYVSEICEDHNRAKFGCFLGFFHQIGHFFAYVVGPILNLRYFSLVITSPALIFLIFFSFFPESPFYLMSKGEEDTCKNALQKLRSNKSKNELQVDFNNIENSAKTKSHAKSASVLQLFKMREHRFALMLALLPLFVQHLSGVAVIMSFLAPFFNSAGTSMSGNTIAVIVSTVKTSCFLFTSFVVERFGRKRMLLISAFGTGVPLFILGLFFYLKHINSPFLSQLQWLPLLGLLFNVIFYSMGLGPIPMALINELFPSELKAAANCVIWTSVSVLITALTSSYPVVSEVLGIHWCVWMFSGCCFIGAILIYWLLPETKGKSFVEIQEMLRKY